MPRFIKRVSPPSYACTGSEASQPPSTTGTGRKTLNDDHLCEGGLPHRGDRPLAPRVTLFVYGNSPMVQEEKGQREETGIYQEIKKVMVCSHRRVGVMARG